MATFSISAHFPLSAALGSPELTESAILPLDVSSHAVFTGTIVTSHASTQLETITLAVQSSDYLIMVLSYTVKRTWCVILPLYLPVHVSSFFALCDGVAFSIFSNCALGGFTILLGRLRWATLVTPLRHLSPFGLGSSSYLDPRSLWLLSCIFFVVFSGFICNCWGNISLGDDV